MKYPKQKKTASKRQSRRKNMLAMTGTHTLASAPQLREKIIQRMTTGEAMTIDAGAAESIDLGSLQLLVSAQRAAAARGQKLSIIAPAGSAIHQLAQACGFIDSSGRSLIPEVSQWFSSKESVA